MVSWLVVRQFIRMLMMVLMTWGLLDSVSVCEARCNFEAMFSFGDSNSDTGGFWASFPAQSGPYGMTFFKKPSGRASDGRLIVDFLAQAIGIPMLSPYLQSIASNYMHGANFATLASTVLLPNTSLFVTGISPFSLAIQVNQMKEFKAKVLESETWGYLPFSDVFNQSIYTFYIGQNDFTSNLATIGVSGVQQYLPQVVAGIVGAIKEVYELGGRTFLVLNLAPVGCYPAFIMNPPHNTSDLDEYGCVVSYNNAVVEYNKMLKDGLQQIQKDLINASVIYVDTHSVYLELFRHPKDHGLLYGPKACCGQGGGTNNFNPQLFCGKSKKMGGNTVTAKACEDPFNYVSWDGIHATEAANKLITWAILNGSYFDPPFPLSELCDLKPIG